MEPTLYNDVKNKKIAAILTINYQQFISSLYCQFKFYNGDFRVCFSIDYCRTVCTQILVCAAIMVLFVLYGNDDCLDKLISLLFIGCFMIQCACIHYNAQNLLLIRNKSWYKWIKIFLQMPIIYYISNTVAIKYKNKVSLGNI